MSFDPKELDPGIRGAVMFLRAHKFNTTDSGDGISKLVGGRQADDCINDFPHVFMVTPPGQEAFDEAHRLWDLIQKYIVDPEGIVVELMYSPIDGTAILGLIDHSGRGLLQVLG